MYCSIQARAAPQWAEKCSGSAIQRTDKSNPTTSCAASSYFPSACRNWRRLLLPTAATASTAASSPTAWIQRRGPAAANGDGRRRKAALRRWRRQRRAALLRLVRAQQVAHKSSKQSELATSNKLRPDC